jgi:hypothetical protein
MIGRMTITRRCRVDIDGVVELARSFLLSAIILGALAAVELARWILLSAKKRADIAKAGQRQSLQMPNRDRGN